MLGASVAVIVLCGVFTLMLSWILNRTIHEILVDEAKKVEEKWFPAACCYCKKEIEVKLRTDQLLDNPYLLRGNACYNCIPEDCSLRDGLNESAFETRDLITIHK